jgi:hypothetical protein
VERELTSRMTRLWAIKERLLMISNCQDVAAKFENGLGSGGCKLSRGRFVAMAR